jgi:hypothetical protein
LEVNRQGLAEAMRPEKMLSRVSEVKPRNEL